MPLTTRDFSVTNSANDNRMSLVVTFFPQRLLVDAATQESYAAHGLCNGQASAYTSHQSTTAAACGKSAAKRPAPEGSGGSRSLCWGGGEAGVCAPSGCAGAESALSQEAKSPRSCGISTLCAMTRTFSSMPKYKK